MNIVRYKNGFRIVDVSGKVLGNYKSIDAAKKAALKLGDDNHE